LSCNFINMIPFLVIETIKTEYRRLKTFREHSDEGVRRLAGELEVYTPGNERVSPFRFNPLGRISKISTDERIDNIMGCLRGTMPLLGPMPALLRESLERVYEYYPEPDKPPIMADLAEVSERVLKEKGYSPDTNSDIRGALDVRLGDLTRGSIGRVFQCRHSTPSIEHLMKVPAIIELDALHLDQASILIFFLLTAFREHLRTLPNPDKIPRYVIIIEEAHNMVGRFGEARASPDIADPKVFAAEYFCRMLAEVRALGVAILIVDQLPSSVAAEVIKNTATKISFRHMDQKEREVMGSSMLMSTMEGEELGRLKTGEAFICPERYHRPRRITTVNLHAQYDFSSDVVNERILPYIREDSWFRQAALQRTINELAELKDRMDSFDNRRLRLIPEMASLLARQSRIMAHSRSGDRSKGMAELRDTAYRLKKRLSDAYRSFLRNSYRRYLRLDAGCEAQDALLEEMRKNLVNRFESITKPDVEKCLEVFGEFIRRCGPA